MSGNVVVDVKVKQYIEKLLEYKDLSEDEAVKLMRAIMSGKVNEAELASILTALRMKGESIDEISAFARVMREYAEHVEVDNNFLLDTCGTGGDLIKTFNISTMSALILSAAGVPIAKHGNRAVSSKAGSADFLEGLGINISLKSDQVANCIKNVGFGFMFAPLYHPAMKYAMPTRRALGIRTIFNILGPLTNPSLVKRQVLGVFDPDLVEPIAHVLNKLGAKSAVVVHSEPGIDEIVPYKKVFLGIVKNGYVELQVKTARDFNINEFELDELKGDGLEYNLKVFADIIKGVDKGIKRDIVVLNAAYGLLVAEKAKNLEVAKHVINRIIDSGQVIEQVKKIIKCSGGDMAKFDKLMES